MNEWVDVKEREPFVTETNNWVTVITYTKDGKVLPMDFGFERYAKTERGRSIRWKWHNMLSPWTVTHWMYLPEPPEAK